MQRYNRRGRHFISKGRTRATCAERCAKPTDDGMYALSRGPSKIVASTRRGTPRPIEVVPENSRQEQSERVDSDATMSAEPRPIFNHNGRTRNHPRPSGNNGVMSSTHQELYSFLKASWERAKLDYNKRASTEGGPEWYREKEANPAYANFKKVDWEEFFVKKTMRRYTES